MLKFTLLLLIVIPLSACDKEETFEPSKRSNVKVVLPVKPNLQHTETAKRYPDGTYTVTGLMSDRDQALGKEVTVRGELIEVVLCPGMLTEDPTPCDPPQHAILADSNNNRQTLTIYGSMKSQLAQLEAGKEITLTGLYQTMSKDGVFLVQRGLISLPEPPEPEPEPATDPTAAPTAN